MRTLLALTFKASAPDSDFIARIFVFINRNLVLVETVPLFPISLCKMDEGAQTAFSSASRPMKYAVTFAVFYCTFALGIITTVVSPTAKDFEYKLDSDTNQIGTIFSIITVAYLLGAFSGGIIFNFVSRQIAVVFLLAISTACLFLFPYVQSIAIFFTLGGIMGFGSGGYDTAQVAWILDIWRHEAGPFILGQHFAYSIGTLVTPIIFAPFLTGDSEDTDTTTEAASNDAIFSSTEGYNSTTARAPSAELYIPFAICGCLGVIAVILQIAFYFIFGRLSKSNNNAAGINNSDSNGSEKKVDESSDEVGNDVKSKSYLRQKIIIVVLGCCYAGFYQSMEQCTMQFLPQFAINSKVNLSEAKAATILLALNIGYAAGRGIGIPVVLRVSPHYILAVNFACVLIGNTILFVVGGSSTTWMWVGSIFLGVGFSTMFPAFYAYLEKYLFINDTIAAAFTVCGGGVSAAYPLIVKKYVEDFPKILNYMAYLSFGVTLVVFIALFRYTRRKSVQ